MDVLGCIEEWRHMNIWGMYRLWGHMDLGVNGYWGCTGGIQMYGGCTRGIQMYGGI